MSTRARKTERDGDEGCETYRNTDEGAINPASERGETIWVRAQTERQPHLLEYER